MDSRRWALAAWFIAVVGQVVGPAVGAVGAEVHVVYVQTEADAEQARATCASWGGSLARYSVAPLVIRSLCLDYDGGARVENDSFQSEGDVVMDQSPVSGRGCGDHACWNGYCKCCLAGSERENFVCCIGGGCADVSQHPVGNLSASCTTLAGGACAFSPDAASARAPGGPAADLPSVPASAGLPSWVPQASHASKPASSGGSTSVRARYLAIAAVLAYASGARA